MGDDRKTLLKSLPSKLEPVIWQDTAKAVVELWKVHFGILISDHILESNLAILIAGFIVNAKQFNYELL